MFSISAMAVLSLVFNISYIFSLVGSVIFIAFIFGKMLTDDSNSQLETQSTFDRVKQTQSQNDQQS